MKRVLCAGVVALMASAALAETHQVVIYGATPAGIAAAVEARRCGLDPLLLEPSPKIGGMTTGGLGQTDSGFTSAFGGLARKFYQDIKAYYDKDENWRFQRRDDYRPRGKTCWETGLDSMWTFEPKAAGAVLADWMREAKIVVRHERLDRSTGGVVVREGRIVSIRMENGAVYEGDVFLDCTYEGDLMAAAGVTYATGRESNATYGETINGIERHLMKNHQVASGVSAYVKAGDPSSGLLPGVERDVAAPDGSGDDRIQAYCYRMCLTDVPENRIPFRKPEDYRELDYELLLRNLEKLTPEELAKPAAEWQHYMPWLHSPMPNRKSDTNNRTGVSTDFIAGSQRYPEASYAERAEIERAHLKYQQGLMWTLANHPRVPAQIRNEVARWGTCKDEFAGENGDGWPRQLYVREARRLVGEYVMTEHECRGERQVPHPIAMGAYGMDSHNVRRYVDADGCVKNEGNIEDYSANPPGKPFKRFAPYGIDYGAIVPKRGECTNLLVPVCVSSSHIAFGSMRMEPAFFALGHAAGVAAALAIRTGCAVQDVDYAALRRQLVAEGQVLPAFVPTEKTGAAVQAAIDAAYAVGGGVVRMEPGVYPSGTLYLRSNVELNLAEGAVLLGHDRWDLYDDVDDPRIGKAPEKSKKAFLVCLFQENVAITGKGVIDGQGVAFYHELNESGRFFKKPPHPRTRMVEFVGCRNVRFEDITFKDSPGWTCWIRMCEKVTADRVRIHGDQRMINNDGFHIDGCRTVRIRNCDLKTGDDCVVMRAIVSPNGDSALCEDMLVENCTLDSACQCIRLGCPSDGTIRNGVFRNLKLKGWNGIASQHPVRYLQEGDHGNLTMADILVENCAADCVASAICFWVEDGIEMKAFGNVTFRNLDLKSGKPLLLKGCANTKLVNLRFENVRAVVAAETPVESRDMENFVFDRCELSSGAGVRRPPAVNQTDTWERVR